MPTRARCLGAENCSTKTYPLRPEYTFTHARYYNDGTEAMQIQSPQISQLTPGQARGPVVRRFHNRRPAREPGPAM